MWWIMFACFIGVLVVGCAETVVAYIKAGALTCPAILHTVVLGAAVGLLSEVLSGACRNRKRRKR